VGGIEATGPDGIEDGTPVSLIIRPERLRLGDQGFSAIVSDVSYVGPAKHLQLTSDQLGSLHATVGGDTAIAPGDSVSVSWPADAGWLVP